AQHAFYQLLHQGTVAVTCDFIASAKRYHETHHEESEQELRHQHQLSLANCLAQSRLLAFGEHIFAEQETLPNYKRYPGNQPSTTLICEELSPFAVGSLLAAYEHKVFAQAVLWGINPFDQWGVEMGKVIATETLAHIQSDSADNSSLDSSTKRLLAFIHAHQFYMVINDEVNIMTAVIPAPYFPANDIRGIVGDTLNQDIARWIGRAVAAENLARGEKNIAVARDGRLSGPDMLGALVEGLRAGGCNVINVGQVPTPVLYYAASVLPGVTSGVMVTGSHNPPDYNGFKIMLAGETLSGDAIVALYHRIQNEDLSEGAGTLEEKDISAEYLARITGDIQLARPLKVVVDTGNGVAGELAPLLMEQLGCEVVPLFTEIDGNFPNHHPDPGDPANMQDLIRTVAQTQADLGLGFDGDGDRVGVVTPKGELIYPDR